MVMVTLKSDLFGDRKVSVNIPSKVGDVKRTGDGNGDAVYITKKADGFELKIQNRGKTSIKMVQKRKDALEAAAKFLAPFC